MPLQNFTDKPWLKRNSKPQKINSFWKCTYLQAKENLSLYINRFQEMYHYFTRGVKSTWKPYLSISTDTLQWKLLHYKLQVTNSKTTWLKVLKFQILTVLKTVKRYFTYTKYRLRDALVKETCRSKTVTLWRSWGKRQRQGSVCRHFMEKLKQTISQNHRQTDNHYIQQLTKN